MTGYQIGGLLIMVIGVLMLAASLPLVRVIPRDSRIQMQFGVGVVSWITRLLGTVVCMLGLVTYMQG